VIIIFFFCVICGESITDQHQRPVPIAKLEFRPYIGDQEPGQDNLIGLDACQDCYTKILANRAKGNVAYGKIKTETEK
jgi:hypothetical protein